MTRRIADKHRVFGVVALVVFALDRATKIWVQLSLEIGERLDVIPGFFYLTHVRNPGAAFGLFANSGAEIKVIAFSAVAALALVIIVIQLRSLAPGEKRESTALALVAGGALGNLVDRLPYFGSVEVIDFLHFDWWHGYPWPDFNLADIAIVVGVGLLVVEMVAREAASHSDIQRDSSQDE
ncbi:MAG: signal peptidase II [Myxococcota bacterium]|nr:signal peptidase II [Myxococcota bacterium]